MNGVAFAAACLCLAAFMLLCFMVMLSPLSLERFFA
jgi:hypothetical protein